MIYKNCTPDKILVALAVEPSQGRTVAELARVIDATKLQILDSLPDLCRAGKVIREGKRKRYRYRLPNQGSTDANVSEAMY